MSLDSWPDFEDNGLMRILILGGTTEASALVAALAGNTAFSPILSLAGRTSEPKPAPIPTRIGGFGGAEGLARFVREEGIAAVIDATHPFAAIMSHNAARASDETGVPLLALRRPPWVPREGDRWTKVASIDEAVSALGPRPRRVFLTVGRLELAAFAAAPQHFYVVRTIEPIGDALPTPHVIAIRDRAPFHEEAEQALMTCEKIDVLVTKNSGGLATYPKIAAARTLGLPAILVTQPKKPAGVQEVETAEAALAWLHELRHQRHGRTP
jgi:precorrin-6A/cobalt-precorrin-6A reductase